MDGNWIKAAMSWAEGLKLFFGVPMVRHSLSMDLGALLSRGFLGCGLLERHPDIRKTHAAAAEGLGLVR